MKVDFELFRYNNFLRDFKFMKSVLISPVKRESGIIPSGQKKSFNYEHLNFPGKELNVTDITEQ